MQLGVGSLVTHALLPICVKIARISNSFDLAGQAFPPHQHQTKHRSCVTELSGGQPQDSPQLGGQLLIDLLMKYALVSWRFGKWTTKPSRR